MPVFTGNDDKPPELSKIFWSRSSKSTLLHELGQLRKGFTSGAHGRGSLLQKGSRLAMIWRSRLVGYMTLDHGYMTRMGYFMGILLYK